MQSGKQETNLNNSSKIILVLFFAFIICSLLLFRNLFFQPTLLLKSFGELSMDPELSFKNNKPTFLEFYAEWCEVCKEMAPQVSKLREEYRQDINFVFLNVDNPKWENYIRKFDVNGIPQINLFNKDGDLEAKFIGKQEEKNIKGSIINLFEGKSSKDEFANPDFSIISKKKNYKANPRTHG